MGLLSGQTAIITGATRGIGRGIAETFVTHGAHVAFTYSSSEKAAREMEHSLSTNIIKVIGYKSDASVLDQAKEFSQTVLKDFGSIDILVNNVGITKDNLLMRMSEEDYDRVITVNLKSVFNLTKAVQTTMLKQRKGSIVNMSSIVGLKGNAGQANYAASKAGIIGFSKSVALELGSRNIRCNVVAPGFITTEMTDKLDQKVVDEWIKGIPLRRAGTPKDIANACLYLASDMSSYVTGKVLTVDGGMLT